MWYNSKYEHRNDQSLPLDSILNKMNPFRSEEICEMGPFRVYYNIGCDTVYTENVETKCLCHL